MVGVPAMYTVMLLLLFSSYAYACQSGDNLSCDFNTGNCQLNVSLPGTNNMWVRQQNANFPTRPDKGDYIFAVQGSDDHSGYRMVDTVTCPFITSLPLCLAFDYSIVEPGSYLQVFRHCRKLDGSSFSYKATTGNQWRKASFILRPCTSGTGDDRVVFRGTVNTPPAVAVDDLSITTCVSSSSSDVSPSSSPPSSSPSSPSSPSSSSSPPPSPSTSSSSSKSSSSPPSLSSSSPSSSSSSSSPSSLSSSSPSPRLSSLTYISPSFSSYPSPSPSATPSPSPSPSHFPSPFPSPSLSLSPATSTSPSQSPSHSPSLSPSPSLSLSSATSTSQSQSPSLSPSPSQSPSPSTSPSKVSTLSWSLSHPEVRVTSRTARTSAPPVQPASPAASAHPAPASTSHRRTLIIVASSLGSVIGVIIIVIVVIAVTLYAKARARGKGSVVSEDSLGHGDLKSPPSQFCSSSGQSQGSSWPPTDSQGGQGHGRAVHPPHPQGQMPEMLPLTLARPRGSWEVRDDPEEQLEDLHRPQRSDQTATNGQESREGLEEGGKGVEVQHAPASTEDANTDLPHLSLVQESGARGGGHGLTRGLRTNKVTPTPVKD